MDETKKIADRLKEMFIGRLHYATLDLLPIKIRFYMQTLSGHSFAHVDKAITYLTMSQPGCPSDFQILELCREYKRAAEPPPKPHKATKEEIADLKRIIRDVQKKLEAKQ